jgi:lipopolysaccharide/colanic/teichoic acid biosynthesis glycosyltransferase
MPAPNARTRVTYDLIKRTIDVAAVVALFAVTWPLLVAATIAVRLVMGRPVLYRSVRAGRHGEPFELLKLRTMRPPGRDETGPASDAHRLTRLGALLRATSIDELPSLLNVLKGDMSLVGPRPLPPQYLARYSREQARRHDVKPGITGWAQVNGRNAISWEEKLTLDVWYVEHRSLALDCRILAMTPARLFRREGISHTGHATMPEFRGTLPKDGADPATEAGEST